VPSTADSEGTTASDAEALSSTASSTADCSSSQSLLVASSSSAAASSSTPSPPQPPATLVGSLLSTPPTQLQDGLFAIGTKHSDALLAAVSGLARSLYRERLYEDAEPMFRRAAAVAEARHGAASTAAGVAVNCLARALDRLGRRAEAKVFHRRVRDSCSAAASEGRKLLLAREPEDALPLLRRALALTEAMKGPQHTATGKALAEVAKCLSAQGEHASAIPIFQRALAVLDAGDQSNSPGSTPRGFTSDKGFRDPAATSSTAGMAVPSAANAEKVSVLNGLASALYQTGSYAAAEIHFRRASTSASTLHGDAAHPQAVAAAESASLCHALSARAAICLEVLISPTASRQNNVSHVGDAAQAFTEFDNRAKNYTSAHSHDCTSSVQNDNAGREVVKAALDDSSSITHSLRPERDGAAFAEQATKISMQKVDVPWAPVIALPPRPSVSSNSQTNDTTSTSKEFKLTAQISVEASLNPFFEISSIGDHFEGTTSASAPTAVESSKAEPSWSLKLVAAEPIWAHVALSNRQAGPNGDTDSPATAVPVVASPSSLQGCAALVSRGHGPFHEKVDRCARAGALAVLVMNDDEERPDAALSMAAPPNYTSPVPAMMISWRDGCRLLNHLNVTSSSPSSETSTRAANAFRSDSAFYYPPKVLSPSEQPSPASIPSQDITANTDEGRALDGITSSKEVVVVFRHSPATCI